MPQLDANNSVLLSISEVPAYLDKALKALDLHVEARTSFITYWLPDLLKHQYIALRFVPQKEYEKAAVLDILPTPNVVERIFMLFQGIESALATNPEWVHAKEKAEADVLFWREVVGLPGEAGELMKDDSLFRVLEWGGMEVL
ncbi:hypothetical protein DL93DRAFT_2079861 [Clavulina sp. PMI_390]|nr:hypothetical protein DL93DRAFT_2079861 [Clavulina sp. PMI_390]